MLKHLPANAVDVRDLGSIPGSGRAPGGGNDNLLQYSCLGNPTDRAVWKSYRQSMGSQSQTQLNARACMLYMNNLSSTIVCYKLAMLSII